MKHDYLMNTPLDEAKALFFSALKELPFEAGEETIDTAAADGRILASAAYAAISAPHYNASAMDGIAVRAEDTYGASEREPLILPPDKYTVVDTGDPLPAGTDAVIMVEDVREEPEGNVRILAAASPWMNVRQVGEDLCMGDMIAPAGTVLTPPLLGALLAGGVTRVSVKKRPRFGIIPTGDEIVKPTGNPGAGEIIEFNSVIFSSMLRRWDADAVVYDIVKDKKDLLETAVRRACDETDAVLILAGSSAGRDDLTAGVVRDMGQLLLHGVAIKPGKPVVLGQIHNKPVLGLPGYPVSAMVVMEEFVRPMVDLYYKRQSAAPLVAEAVLTKRVVSSLKYKEFVRVSVGSIGGVNYAVPLPRGAGVITSVTKAHGILEVDQNREGVEAGSAVNIRMLGQPDNGSTLVITGSHDPLIDEVADEARKRGIGLSVVSSHVGSMGAIQAVKAGYAHMGGIHLLDEETGKYNESYVKKHFPDGGARIIKGVERIQGLMVRHGNPLGIREIADLKNCRYVNRQRGAGTRILFDYMLKQNGLQPSDINGYENEKFTHTAVAATVAAGNADAGMGILSAAKIYGLDFIPLYHEEYDFLVAESASDDPGVRAFFEILHSHELRRRLTELGGYRLLDE
ncbi:MAG: molybdopterin biosynthesis protein [Clostridia bacterium]|nr:molybdopterin biosynthesis protein [Clostridia bacterium]